MNNITKFMVVPYVKPIERPTDSRVLDLDNEMTSVLSNPQLSIEDKVRLYGQTLSRFQTYYDPATYGESSTTLDMASTVKAIADEVIIAKNDRDEKAKTDVITKEDIVKAIADKPVHQINTLISTHRKRKSKLKSAEKSGSTDTEYYDDESDELPSDIDNKLKLDESELDNEDNYPIKIKQPKITEAGMNLDAILSPSKRRKVKNAVNQNARGLLWLTKKFF